MTNELNESGKEQVALALILLKDYKTEGKMDLEITKMVIELAQHLEVLDQYNKLLPIIPPMKIEPRY
jgi:hypothetical protein